MAEYIKVRYRKVSIKIWNDKKFRSLSDDAQFVFLFLLTHPHLTPLGAMRESLPGLAAEKRWPADRFLAAFNEIEIKRMIQYDCDSFFLWFPSFLKHNGPENPNVVKSWGKSIQLLPECELRAELILHAISFLKGLPKAFQEAFQEALPKAFQELFRKSMANQEQEQKQEHKQKDKNGGKPPAAEKGKSKDGIPPELQSQVAEVISRINDLSGIKYKSTSEGTTAEIVRNLRDGQSTADMILIAEFKWREWGGTDMAQNFNPATLYRKKHFDTYLAQAKAINGANGGAPAFIELPDGYLQLTANKVRVSRITYEQRYGKINSRGTDGKSEASA